MDVWKYHWCLTNAIPLATLDSVIRLQKLAGPVTGGVPAGAPFFITEGDDMAKPFMTYDQQLQQMRDKHLIIADNDRVKETLRQVGYFSLISGYNEHKAWGNKFIENLAADIRREFPGSKGYSVRNLSKSRLDLYGSRICADSVCTNPLVTQYSNYGQCQGS